VVRSKLQAKISCPFKMPSGLITTLPVQQHKSSEGARLSRFTGRFGEGQDPITVSLDEASPGNASPTATGQLVDVDVDVDVDCTRMRES